jgi:porin
MMRRLVVSMALVTLLGMFLCGEVFAQDESKPYSGDIWSGSTLTGDWGGARNDLSAKGITFDMNLTQIGQGVTDGGKDMSWQYGGRGNLTVNVDTQKLGLWPGGFFTAEFEGNFNDSVNGKTGALVPVNTNQLFPMPTGDNLNVPEVSFAQFFSPYAGVTIGKYATITNTSGDMNEFAHGKGDVQFFNLAFSINPVALMTVPYSTWGAGVIVLPTKDPNAASVNFMVLQGNGEPNTIGLNDLTSHKMVFAGEGRIRTGFFGLTGHQSIGASYSNKEFTDLDQYLYEPNKSSGQGVGVFGRFGASDGNPNPVHFFLSAGVGGKGIIPCRPLDRLGVGYYYIDVKSITLQGPLAERRFLRDEQGMEAFYNIAITPWMQVTPDLQIIRGAQKESVIGGVSDVHTATILGLRLNLVF